MKHAIRVDYKGDEYLSDYLERSRAELERLITKCLKGEYKVIELPYKGDYMYFPREVLKNSVITIISNDNRH